VVFFHGLKIPKSDRVMLKIFQICARLVHFKIRRYKWLHVVGTSNTALTNQLLHIDDPTYSIDELRRIRTWNEKLKSMGLKRVLVVTNEYSKKYYGDIFKDIPVHIVEQGFTEVDTVNFNKNQKFSCVYSSPYIDYGQDRHAKHSAWGSSTLIDEILPRLMASDSEVEVHLLGELGKEAKKAISIFPNVICHGYVDRYRNAEILQSCHVSIYPRIYDHFRAVQKIAEYIGAGNPIVAFKLVDTELVSKFELGITVNSAQEFVEAIIALKQNEKYLRFKKNVEAVQKKFSWKELALKLELIVEYHDVKE
jgi:hypothetical protein